MRKEENVELEGTPTEDVAVANEERASTVLGKFKDVDALTRAYEALEAEFTRRSQKLRSLEKEVENLKTATEWSGAEKLRKTAKARREAAREFDAFVAEVDKGASAGKPTENSAQDISAVSGEETAMEEAPRKEGVEGQFAMGKSGEATPQENVGQEKNISKTDGDAAEKGAIALDDGRGVVSSETLYKLARNDEAVRLRIVGEYLSSLGRSGVPLTGGTARAITAPPKKAKTVGQAGAMALSYFQKPIS